MFSISCSVKALVRLISLLFVQIQWKLAFSQDFIIKDFCKAKTFVMFALNPH